MDKSETIVCENCGASFSINEPKCPFCGEINQYGAEKQYLQNMQDIKANLAMVDDEQEEITKGEIKKSVKLIITVSIVAIALVVVISLIRFVFTKTVDRVIFGGDVETSEVDKALWMQENQPVLDKMYEEKDYQGLIDFYMGMFHSDGNNPYIFFSEWEHANLISSMAAADDLDYYLESETLYDFDYHQILFTVLSFYNEDYKNMIDLPQDQLIYEDYMQDFMEYACDLMKLDDETIADIISNCSSEYGYIDPDAVAKYYDNYLASSVQ